MVVQTSGFYQRVVRSASSLALNASVILIGEYHSAVEFMFGTQQTKEQEECVGYYTLRRPCCAVSEHMRHVYRSLVGQNAEKGRSLSGSHPFVIVQKTSVPHLMWFAIAYHKKSKHSAHSFQVITSPKLIQ